MPFRPTPENISHVKFMLLFGNSVEDIAIHFNCTIKCIKKWRGRLAQEAAGGQATVHRRKFSHRPDKISGGRLQLITNYIAQHPSTPVKHLAPILNLPVHYNTLRSTIKKQTILRFRPAKKCMLTDGDHAARLAYARTYVNRPAQF